MLCDMIAMKREVAAHGAGFPWSECQVKILATSHCTIDTIYRCVETQCGIKYDTHGGVYSHRLSY